MIPQWERVRTNKGWHIRFRAGNGEPVVHGENLTSKGACDTAICSVAAAHSPVGVADIAPLDRPAVLGRDVVLIRTASPFSVRVPVVDVDERRTFLGRRRG